MTGMFRQLQMGDECEVQVYSPLDPTQLIKKELISLIYCCAMLSCFNGNTDFNILPMGIINLLEYSSIGCRYHCLSKFTCTRPVFFLL